MRLLLFNHRSIGPKIYVVSLVLVLSLGLLSSVEVKAQGDYYDRDFEWDYGGKHWTWSLSILKSLYGAYKSVPVSTRVKNGLEGYGFLTTTNDYYLQMIAGKLNETASQEGYDSYDEVSFVLAFVQSLPYTSDSVTSGYDEYPRFPIETLVDGGGDCEDTSILFATITLIMNYGTVYINPPDHLAVGVLGKDLPGSYYIYDGKTYYYCETTGNGWKIGELPDEFKDQEVHIYNVNTFQQYVPPSEIVSSVTPSPSISPSPSVTPTPSIPFDSSFDSLGLFLALLVVVVILIVAVVSISAKKGKEPVISKSAIPEPNVPFEPRNVIIEGTKFCRYCGSANRMDALFCEKCGRNIE